MDLQLEFGTTFCCTNKFVINGTRADATDFGEQYDRDPENAEDCGCGDMHFTPTPPTDEVLKKYRITACEYALIASQLEAGLSFGACGCCV